MIHDYQDDDDEKHEEDAQYRDEDEEKASFADDELTSEEKDYQNFLHRPPKAADKVVEKPTRPSAPPQLLHLFPNGVPAVAEYRSPVTAAQPGTVVSASQADILNWYYGNQERIQAGMSLNVPAVAGVTNSTIPNSLNVPAVAGVTNSTVASSLNVPAVAGVTNSTVFPYSSIGVGSGSSIPNLSSVDLDRAIIESNRQLGLKQPILKGKEISDVEVFVKDFFHNSH